MQAPFPKSGIPSMMGDQMGSSQQSQQAQLSQALSSMSDEDLMNMINSNPQVKEQYEELLKKHAKETGGNLKKGGVPATKPVTSKEYYTIEKNLEKYLDQEGGIVIDPEPRFVFKTFEAKTMEKFFINIVTHPLIDLPEEKYMVDYENQPGLRVPMSLGRLKEDSDKKGEVCKVVDAIVNPKVADNLQTDPGLSSFFIQLIQSYCQQKYKVDLSEKFIIPKLKYKGKSVEVQRVKGKKAPKITQLTEEEEKTQDMISKSGKKLVEEMTQGGKPTIPTGIIPRPKWNLHFVMQDDKEVEYDGDFTLNGIKYVKIRVELPLLVTGKFVELKVSKQKLYMRNGKYYELSLKIPISVDSCSAKSVFSTSKRLLIILLKPQQIIEEKPIISKNSAPLVSQTKVTKSDTATLSNDLLDDLV